MRIFQYCFFLFRIRETQTLSTDEDSSTAAKKLLSIFLKSLPAADAAAGAKGLLAIFYFLLVGICWYQCHYPYMLRDSVSPVCGSFFSNLKVFDEEIYIYFFSNLLSNYKLQKTQNPPFFLLLYVAQNTDIAS